MKKLLFIVLFCAAGYFCCFLGGVACTGNFLFARPFNPFLVPGFANSIHAYPEKYDYRETKPSGLPGENGILKLAGASDAGMQSIDGFDTFCRGTQEVKVTIRNFGSNILDSCWVNWEINGVMQDPYRFAGRLDTAGGMGPQAVQLTLGQYYFASGTSYALKVYTSLPNGMTDMANGNDTLRSTVLPSFGGTYTIDKNNPTGGSNFNSFTAAIQAVSAAGVCDPVVFKVAPNSGPYNEKVTIGNIPGASATRTLTFDGGATKERIFTGATSSISRHVIQLNGARHIILKNLTIQNTATTQSIGVHLLNQADSNLIEGCIVQVNNTAGPTAGAPVGGIVASQTSTTSFLVNGNPANYTTIRNCEVDGGWVNVIFVGPSTTVHNSGNRVENCELKNAITFGIASYDQDYAVFSGNRIRMRGGVATAYGIYTYFNDNLDIIGNFLERYHVRGIYVEQSNARVGAGNGLTRIANNMISNDPVVAGPYSNAIHLNGTCYDVKIWHNSVSLTGGNTDVRALYLNLSSSSGIDIRNNALSVFKSGSGNLALYVSSLSTSALSHLDYNNYYTPSSSVVLTYGSSTYNSGNLTNAAGAHSRFGNPQFINNASNLHSAGTQLHNWGDSTLALTYDFDGDLRPAGRATRPDVGADEYEREVIQATLLGFTAPGSDCGLTDSMAVTLRLRNSGLNAIPSVSFTYVLNGGSPVSETYSASLPANQTLDFTFSTPANMQTPGAYTLDGWITVAGDSIQEDDSVFAYTVAHSPLISTFPYLEDFESGAGGWRAEGNAEWEWGTPAGSVIDTAASGMNAWVTDLDGTYENNACGALLSPCFDFSNLVEPTVSLALWWDTEFSWDGLLLQSSTDQGANWVTVGNLGDPNNWYTDDGIDALQACVNQGQGWSGGKPSGEGSGGWLMAEQALPQLAGEAEVRFRLSFGSDGSWVADGVGMDDFAIRDLPAVDVGAVALISPGSGDCGDSAAVVTVVIENYGSEAQTRIPVSVSIDTNGVQMVLVSATYTDTLAIKSRDTLVVGTFNGYSGGVFQVSLFTAQAGDADRSNDTLHYGQLLINQTPGYPTVVGGTQRVICTADSVLLNVAAQPGFSYSWYVSNTAMQALVSDTSQFMTPYLRADRTYFVGAVNAGTGCAGPRTQIDIRVSQLQPVNLGPDTTLCAGRMLTLNAGNPGASFAWSTGGTGQTETVSAAGTYSVLVRDTLGCERTDTVEVNIAPAAIASFTAQQVMDSLVVKFTNASSGYGNLSYLWEFGDRDFSREQDPSHTYASSGRYEVCLTVVDYCGTVKSCDTLEVTPVTSLDDGLLSGAISLFPNPTDGKVFVTVSDLDADVAVSITDLTGRRIATRRILRSEQNQTITFDLSGQAEGLYLVRFEAEGRRLLRKVVLER